MKWLSDKGKLLNVEILRKGYEHRCEGLTQRSKLADVQV